jgi:hypothetical protein
MKTRFVRHKLNKTGQCDWCGKGFTESEAEGVKRFGSPLVEPESFAYGKSKSYTYENMLKDSERAEVVNCKPEPVTVKSEEQSPSDEDERSDDTSDKDLQNTDGGPEIES